MRSHVIAIAVLTAVFVPAVVRADAIDDWNARAIAAILAANRTPTVGFIELTIVQAAVYDAVNAIDGGRHQQYASSPQTNPAASIDAAAAQAAHDVLVWLYPAQAAALDASLAATLGAIPAGSPKLDGIAAGASAASALIALRTNDGRDAPIGYTPGSAPGDWQPTPPAFLAAQTPWVAFVRPFAIQSPSQFRPGPPPSLSSNDWAEAFNEVKQRGALAGSNRTAEETTQALFWTDNAPSQYNRYFRRIATEQILTQADKARMYAEINMAAADAGIACFDGKYAYGFWRPVTAIPAADTDDTPHTVADPGWLPLATTPNHPEYPSAHACVSGAIAATLAAFFGTDHVTTTVDSNVTHTAVTFDRFKDVFAYVYEARILAGLHYRFSMNAGRQLGRQVSARLVQTQFKPVQR